LPASRWISISKPATPTAPCPVAASLAGEAIIMKLSKIGFVCAGLIVFAAPALLAKDPPTYDKGTLLSMDSTSCGYAEKDAKSVTGEILGTDSSHKNTEEVLCQEYVLQSDRMIYRLRPKDTKHPMLLPVGESIDFRVHKDLVLLRDPEGDKKEREYIVVSIQPRPDVKEARNTH
jgi:hypothetical protein